MNNHPGNHPLYPLGNPTNIQLLDNMFNLSAAAAAEQQAAVHKPAAATIIPQYAAYQAADMQHQASLSHHAMNLTQPHLVSAANEAAAAPQVIVYHEAQQQQQPISYKIPQMEAAAAAPSVVTPAAAQISGAAAAAQHIRAQQHHIPHKKKDIMAEATSKIFEDIGSGAAHAKKSVPPSAAPGPSGHAPGGHGPGPGSVSSLTPSTTPLHTAIKSEPMAGPSSPTPSAADSIDMKPIAGPSGFGFPVQSGRGRGRGGATQQVVPRLHLLEDEDDGLTCRMCLQQFWYKSHLMEHLKSNHSIAEPDKYEREEREKKLKRVKSTSGFFPRPGRGRGRGRGRPPASAKPAGPKPSFQYRDGSFICDLCKKSFSDGNEMVTHWKSHVKEQRMFPRRRGRPPGMFAREIPASGQMFTGPASLRGRGGRGGRARGRADKGQPRWTAYLVWSTRRRKAISQEDPDLTFAEVAKQISNEWREISIEEKDQFQQEAEEMNLQGIRKMKPREVEYESETTDWTSDSDPDFEDKLDFIPQIKKEELDDIDPDGTAALTSDDDDDDDEDGEGVTRSSRKRKRPSFFQEFENEENNLDKILDEFEMEQIEAAKKPKEDKPKPPPRDPSTIKRRRRRKRTPSPTMPEQPVELETSRSGRIRKKTKFRDYFEPEDGEIEGVDARDDEDSEDRDEYKPESEVEGVISERDESISDELSNAEDDLSDSELEDDLCPSYDQDGEPLPAPGPGEKKKKKKKKPRGPMTDEEIEAARRAALSKAQASEDELSDSSDESSEETDDEDDDEEEGTDGLNKKSDEVKVKKEPQDADEATKDAAGATQSGAGDGSAAVSNPAAAEMSSNDGGADKAMSAPAPVNSGEAMPGETAKNDQAVAPPGNDLSSTGADALADASHALGDIGQAMAAPSENSDKVPSAAEGDSQTKEGDVAGGSADTSKETPKEAMAKPPDATEVDLLTSAASSQMEEGDDKFKDIIAEGQIDNIFN